MGLNHIYKVIWSKTKNAWVVVSEIAKRDGKSSVKSVITSLAGKSVAAVMVAMVMCGGVASANTAYGTGATATGSNSTAIGDNASATGSGGVAMGNGSSANEGVAIGDNSLSQFKSIAMGPNAKSGQYSVSIGELADTTEAGSMRNVAIGYRSKATDDGSISIGPNATAKGSTSIAIGSQAETGRQGSIAMGYAVRNAQDNAISIGSAVTNYSDHTAAIGHNVNIAVGAKYGTAIGVQSKINGGLRNTSIGYNNYVANGGDTSTFGSGNKVAGTYTTVIGTDNNYGSNVSVANRSGIFGYHNILNATSGVMEDSYIIGANNEVNARRTIVLGNNITVPDDMENAVVLGDHSNATPYSQASNVTVGGITLEANRFAANVALSKGSILSIGSNGIAQRQIKNVAAGVISATSTDAVNGSQLYEAVRAVSAGASPDVYMHVNDGSGTQGAGNATTNLGKVNEKGGATGQYSITIGLSSTAKSKNSIVIGKNGRDMDADSDNSVVMGTEAQVGLAQNGIAIGKRAMLFDDGPTNPRNDNSIAIGNNAVIRQANNSIVLGKDSNITGGDNSVAIGSNVVVTRGQLNVGGGYSTSSNSQYGNQRGGNQGIAVGSNSAVSGSIGSTSIGRYSSIIGADDSVVIGSYSGIKFTDDGSTITVPKDIHVLGNRSFVKGASNITVLGNDINVEYVPNNPATDFSGSVIMGDKSTANSYVKPTDSTINGDTFTSADYAGQGTTTNPLKNGNIVSVGSVGNERQIKNVAAGEVTATSTDAINGSQLYSVADQLAKGGFGYMHVNDGTTTQKASTTATNYGAGGSKAGATGTKSIAGGVNAQAAGEKAIAVGADATASGGAAIAIGKSSAIDSYGTKGIVLGSDNNITNTAGGILLGNDSSIVGTVLGGPVGNSSQYSVLIGTQSHITDSYNAVSIGITSNISQSNSSVVIGNHTTATNSHQGIAIGESSTVKNAQFGIAIGTGSEVSGQSGIAIGLGANASGEKSISIGTGNEVKGNKSSAIGDPSYIDTTATGTHVQGNDNGTATNPIKASESTFMGNTNLAGTAGTTGIHVVGNNNSVDSSNVMVMGNGVTVGTGLDGAVVLGHASSADQHAAATDSTINGVTFEAAGYAGNTGLNNGSIVSVGATGAERQIKNVAAGAVTATSTDAVNGSQLYKTAETILKMPINMAGDSGDTVGLKLGKTVNIKGSVASAPV